MSIFGIVENTHGQDSGTDRMEQRYVKDSIEADLADRMVFIGGPRQVGKTTLALSLLEGQQDESSEVVLVCRTGRRLS